MVAPGAIAGSASEQPKPEELACAEMPAGSAVVYLGSTIHAGGRNATADRWRRGMHMSFVVGWLRTEDNNYLSTPPDVARTLPRRSQELLGYVAHDAIAVGGGYLGTVDLLDPSIELLRAGQEALRYWRTPPGTATRSDSKGEPHGPRQWGPAAALVRQPSGITATSTWPTPLARAGRDPPRRLRSAATARRKPSQRLQRSWHACSAARFPTSVPHRRDRPGRRSAPSPFDGDGDALGPGLGFAPSGRSFRITGMAMIRLSSDRTSRAGATSTCWDSTSGSAP